jgi:hypothetical protein
MASSYGSQDKYLTQQGQFGSGAGIHICIYLHINIYIYIRLNYFLMSYLNYFQRFDFFLINVQ